MHNTTHPKYSTPTSNDRRTAVSVTISAPTYRAANAAALRLAAEVEERSGVRNWCVCVSQGPARVTLELADTDTVAAAVKVLERAVLDQRLRRYFPSARVDKDPTAPLLWAVWDGDDLVGAGHTEYQAIRDAITTARGWRT